MVRRLFESRSNKAKSDSKDNKTSEVAPVDEFVDILGLNVESSKPPDPKPENTGNESDFLIFNQDPTFKEPLKEIAIDAEPMDFTDTTPQSVTDSDKLTPSSNESKLTLGAETLEEVDQLDYLDFESAAFEEHKNRELSDSFSEDNAFSDLATVENKTISKPEESDKTDPNKEEFRETEFAKFYDTSYSTELHGDTIVGAFIISYKNAKTEYLFSYPPTLNVNRPYDTKLLKSQYKTESYTANRDTNSELQSCLHLVSDLALGARKNNSLVDFAHFVLPTSSSNVLYGTSYVIQLTDDIQVKTENSEKNSTETKENENELKENPEGPTLVDTGSDETPKQLVKKTSSHLPNGHFVAICLVYKVPFFGLIGSRLEYLAQTYFDNKNFHDHSLLQSFLEHVNKNDKVEDWSYESLFFNLEYHFKPFSLCLSYSKFQN
ncbi:uncharacterized protein TA21465 [Theileria annulata]|uniref:AVL9/DENND6 domain-containing protein n=1 Tax=Theileria annulata TaxID=5874 RepID=Q4UGL4_THEAN|nr:uncharacterized protein TA21465 [Theileria annulata]CAI73775.1 hypothetical protein TA21465 [Theileria annulata]|eukprot:XP_954452.1 hypothetical protein TA21465 [Theileria annulata]